MQESKFLSRKFIVAMIVQWGATVALFFDKIDGSDFATVSSATIASYSLANAATYFKSTDG